MPQVRQLLCIIETNPHGDEIYSRHTEVSVVHKIPALVTCFRIFYGHVYSPII